MNTYYLHKYPYLRLVIPWIAGIFCGDRFFELSEKGFLYGICLFCLFVGLSIGCYFIKHHSFRWCFGISVFLLCFVGGGISIDWQLKRITYVFPSEETVYRAVITDTPKPRERTFLCPVWLKERHTDNNTFCSVEREAFLYVAQDSAVANLKVGDELLVSCRISPPMNRKNFDEFDYARYLTHKGISGTGYVAPKKWRLLPASTLPPAIGGVLSSFRIKAFVYREKVLSLYRDLGFKGDELAVLSALTVGDKSELSESIRESYSVAGVSHVLALSGLHIGLLYGLLYFLLIPLAKRGYGGRMFRSLLLMLLLWSFAVFTGLSPSVVRSVCMFSILALADLFSRKSLTLNTLAATAWLMLLSCPTWLFDIGFQLSFLSVASILLLQNKIYHCFPIKNRVGKYIWGLMSVSIAAQIGSAPLVMYYFFRFSTHFLLTNIIVVPLITLILYAVVVMLLLTPFTWLQSVVAIGIGWLLNGLNTFVRWIEQLPYASIDGIWLYPYEVIGIYVFLLFTFCYFAHRRLRNLVYCLLMLLILGSYHTAMRLSEPNRPSIVFYNVRGCPAVHCVERDGRSWISYGDTLPDKKLLMRAAGNYWNRRHLRPPLDITADYCDANLSVHQQILSYYDRRICMVTDNRWRNLSASSPLPVHYLYLCRGYNGRLEELLHVFLPTCILLDASLSEYRRESFKKECRQLGYQFISLSEEGSVCFLL